MTDKFVSDDPIHRYPGTTILMVPGDVLYSHKHAISSFIVGHTAIIGEDFRIYHVNKWGSSGHADSMPIYLSRHKRNEKLTILRHGNSDEARQAARWAKQYREQVAAYHYKRDLNDIGKNYCSKFIWQAFYFGNDGKVDLTGRSLPTVLKRYIMPFQIYRNLTKIGSFENVLYRDR